MLMLDHKNFSKTKLLSRTKFSKKNPPNLVCEIRERKVNGSENFEMGSKIEAQPGRRHPK